MKGAAKNTVAGIDIGGTKVRWVLVRRRRVVAAGETKTPARRDEMERLLRETMRSLFLRGARRAGVSIAGVIDGTVVRFCPNIPSIRNLRPVTLAPKGMAVRIDNDARCFARAEATTPGAARGATSACAFILGTGIGRAVIKNGAVQTVTRFELPEPWEREYKRKKHLASQTPAAFLAPRLADIAREFRPAVIVIGGGALRKPTLFSLLKKNLRRAGTRCPVRRSRFHQNGPAIGATRLFP